jgi:tetratricopeptide (TPR) repeat protein
VLEYEPWNEDVKVWIEKALAVRVELARKVNRAYSLLEEEDWTGAEVLLAQARGESSPKSEELYGMIVRGMRMVENQRNRERYRQLIEEGDQFLEAEKFGEAREFYLFARKFYPRGTLHGEHIALLERRVRRAQRVAEAAALREEAIGLYDRGKYERSREAWNRLLLLKPEDQEALLYLSKISFLVQKQQHLEERGREYFDTGVRLYREQQYERAITQLESAAALGYRAEEAGALIDEIQRTIARLELERRERDAELVARYLREGIKLYNLNRYRESLNVLNEGLKLDPENTQIREYVLRDTIALREQEEREVSPSSPFYELIQDLGRLAGTSFRKGLYQESIRRWEQILLIFPYNERARRGLARTLMKTDPSLAEEILEGNYREAVDLLDKGKKREAEAKLRMIVEVNPGFRDTRDLLDNLREEEEKTEQATVTDRDRRKARALYQDGLDLYRGERLEEAVSAWREAVRLDPQFVDARVDLSRAEARLRTLRRLSSTEEETGSGLSEEQRITLRRYYLNGVNLFLDGLYQEAITEWEKVVNLDPGYENVQVNIRRAKQRMAYGESS